MDISNEIKLLKENLLCRKRLGLSVVQGTERDLDCIVEALLDKDEHLDLESIAAQMGKCSRCGLAEYRQNLLLGKGLKKAELFVVLGPPTQEEDHLGQSLIGESGRLFDNMLKAVGLDRKNIYFTHIVKCHPSDINGPDEKQLASCQKFLDKEIKAQEPKLICTMGEKAFRALEKNVKSLDNVKGKWFSYKNIPLIPFFEPCFLLNNPQAKPQTLKDLKRLIRFLKEPGTLTT